MVRASVERELAKQIAKHRMLRLGDESSFFVWAGEKDRATVFQIKTLAAVGFLEEAFHFPGARDLLVDFGYLASRK